MSGIELLRHVSLFAGLADEELAALAGTLGRRTFGKGVFIFHKDSPGHTLYIIESGKVRIFVLSDLGHEISINIYGPGDVFGELSPLDGQPRSAGAVTLETTTTLTLDHEALWQFLEAHPRLARNVIQVLAARLRYTTAYAESLAFLDVNGRVAARLLELADRYGVHHEGLRGEEVELGLTQAELASWVAASRESVNKVLCTFRDQGLIEVTGQKVIILDRRGLRRQISQ